MAGKTNLNQRFIHTLVSYTARSTLPERMHRVHAYTCRGEPFTSAFTRFTLGFHIRFDRRWEWLTLMPKETPLSQYAHFAIVLHLPLLGGYFSPYITPALKGRTWFFLCFPACGGGNTIKIPTLSFQSNT